MTNLEIIRGIKRKYEKVLMAFRNVNAVGIGKKETAGARTDLDSIIVFVEKKLLITELKPEEVIPTEIMGIKTDVQIMTRPQILTLKIPRALQVDRTRHWRPAPGGVSVGHVDITAGTLGCWFELKDGKVVMLSNNHVLANCNNGQIGDQIIQPGTYDGGTRSNGIATLEKFIPIVFDDGGTPCPIARAIACLYNKPAEKFKRLTRLEAKVQENKVDAAIAIPFNISDCDFNILEIGPIKGIGAGKVGIAVKKSGRTTAVNAGEITTEDVTVQVGYGDNRIATFYEQLVTTKLAEGGDSGSVVLNDLDEIIGLLFAGSDTQTIVNRIENVITELNLDIEI